MPDDISKYPFFFLAETSCCESIMHLCRTSSMDRCTCALPSTSDGEGGSESPATWTLQPFNGVGVHRCVWRADRSSWSRPCKQAKASDDKSTTYIRDTLNECGHLELELHGALNLKLPKFKFKYFKKSEKILWCRQCCILPVCNFSERNTF
jgi:hypothetical protein